MLPDDRVVGIMIKLAYAMYIQCKTGGELPSSSP
jgi:hypothetical protein